MAEKRPKKRRNFAYIIMSTTILVIILILFGVGVFPYGYNPIALAVAITLPSIVFFVWNKKDFDIVMTAADTAMDSMKNSVILVDLNESVLRYNISALKMFPQLFKGCKLSQIEDFPFADIKTKNEEEFERNGRHYECEKKYMIMIMSWQVIIFVSLI